MGKYFKGAEYSAVGGAALRIENSTVRNIEADFLNNISTNKFGGGGVSIKNSTVSSFTGKEANKTTFVLDSITGITNTNTVTISNSNIQFKLNLRMEK